MIREHHVTPHIHTLFITVFVEVKSLKPQN